MTFDMTGVSSVSDIDTSSNAASMDTTTDGINYQWEIDYTDSSVGKGVVFWAFTPVESSATLPRYDGECDDCDVYYILDEDETAFTMATGYTWASAISLTWGSMAAGSAFLIHLF